MVPIHESDVAENRWKVGEWSSIELWEKVELQLRKRRRWTVVLVLFVFFILSSIPILKDRYPKWVGLKMARSVAEKLNDYKFQAVQLRQAVRLTLSEQNGELILAHRFQPSCTAAEIPPESASPQGTATVFKLRSQLLLTSEAAKGLGLERIVNSICYDPRVTPPATSVSPTEGPESKSEQAMALIPASDLTDHRTDRISFIFFHPQSAEISFD